MTVHTYFDTLNQTHRGVSTTLFVYNKREPQLPLPPPLITMSIQEDPLLSQISLLIAHVQAQSTASSQQQIQDVFIDVSILFYTLSLLYASYKISSKSSSARLPLNGPEKVPFRFLALPPELRFMIYEYLLVSPLPDGRIKFSNAHVAVRGLGLSPQILRVNSEIYAEAVGVLYERNVFQLHFFEEIDDTAEVWGLRDWQKKLFRGMRGCGGGEDEDSADLNRAIEAPDPEVVIQAGPVVGPLRLLQRLPRFMQNLLLRVRFLRHRGMNRAIHRYRPTKIHPHRLRRMRHLEIISSFRGTLSGNGILAENHISPSGENSFMNNIVTELLEYLIAAPSSEDMLMAEDDTTATGTGTATASKTTITETINNSKKKTLQLLHCPDRFVWPTPRLSLADKRRLRLQIRKKFEILHALTHTRRVSVRHDYCLMGSQEDVVDEFEEGDLAIFAGKERREGRALWSQEQMTARVCAGRVGIWEE